MALLTWSDVVAVSYTSDDQNITLTGAQLSVIVQIVALFNSGYLWSDYAENADDIDAMIADLTAALTGGL